MLLILFFLAFSQAYVLRKHFLQADVSVLLNSSSSEDVLVHQGCSRRVPGAEAVVSAACRGQGSPSLAEPPLPTHLRGPSLSPATVSVGPQHILSPHLGHYHFDPLLPNLITTSWSWAKMKKKIIYIYI